MECAGIIEAGGVKNVTFSLCKEFADLGHKVTLFIPVFKTNSWDLITEKRCNKTLRKRRKDYIFQGKVQG